MLKIVTGQHSILSQKAKPCTVSYGAKQAPKVNANILKLIEEMKHALLYAKDPEGVGLAAPQVSYPLRIFIIKPDSKSSIQVFINPTITEKTKTSHLTETRDRVQSLNNKVVKKSPDSDSKNSETQLEGCLSLPNVWGNVKRKPTLTLSYLDENNKARTQKFKGFIATIIQHEYDHLQGILFPKRVLEQKGKLYKSHKNEKGEDVFEEIDI